MNEHLKSSGLAASISAASLAIEGAHLLPPGVASAVGIVLVYLVGLFTRKPGV